MTSTRDVAWFRVEDVAAVGSIRRAVATLTRELGFGTARAGEVTIVASELSTNLARHAKSGTMLLRVVRASGAVALQILAVDAGPGIADVALAGTDGHSSSSTLGVGLGAVRRLADSCDLHTVPGVGTTILATFSPHATECLAERGADGVSRPMANEELCGDAYAMRAIPGGHLVMLADGLGHGPLAAVASSEAVRIFEESEATDPGVLLGDLHRGLRHTRGAAVAIAGVLHDRGVVDFAGIGNVSSWIVEPDRRRGMLSQPGIVGHQARRFQLASFDLPPTAMVLLHSDGLTDRWDLSSYPGLRRHDPVVVAATLLRDAGVRHDDASVLVVGAAA